MDSSQYNEIEDIKDIEQLIKDEYENETFLNKAIDQKLLIDIDNGDANIEILDSMLFTDLQVSPIIIETQTEEEFYDIVKLEETGYVHDNIQSADVVIEEITTADIIMMEKEEPLKEGLLKTLFNASMNVLESNQTMLKSLILKDPKTIKSSEPIECSKCCRQFVHEGGLSRHWDIHVGEILDPSKPENPRQITCVILCVSCGEVFLNFPAAVIHLKSLHVEIIKNSDVKTSTVENINEVVHDSDPSSTSKNRYEIEMRSESSQEQQPIKYKDEAVVLDFPRPDTSLSLELVRLIHITKFYQCEFCESLFCHQNAALVHELTHVPSSAFQCNTCDLKKLTIKEILLHRRDECVVYKDNCIDSVNNLTRVWVCNVCYSEFQGLEQLFLHRHEYFHFLPRFEASICQRKFLCEMCACVFPLAELLTDHYKEKHLKKGKVDTVAETSERIQKPPASSRRGGLHQTSSRPRQFLCEVCGKSYTQSSHLWQHLRFHQGVKPFECTEKGCDRKFTIRPDLNDHIRKCHTGERPYLCTICNKRFLTGSVFYQHRLIHRGERRYGCEECGKRFYRADALKNHLRIHSGEKPHICNVCEKAFRQRGDRDKHVKARHPDAPVHVETKKPRVKSFGRGRIRNNTALYEPKPSADMMLKVQCKNENTQDENDIQEI